MDIEYIKLRFVEAGEHWAAGEEAKARAAFEECISYDHLSDESSTEDIEEATVVLESWMGYATILLDTGHPEEALVAARRGMAFGHFQESGNELLGGCYHELKMHYEAATAFREALKGKPRPGLWVLLSWELKCIGRDEEAKNCLRQALELDQDYEEAHYNLGCWAVREKAWELAETHFLRAVECDPEYAEAHARLGGALLQLRRYHGGGIDGTGLDEAEHHLRLALSFDVDCYWAHIYLGNLGWQKDNLKEAEVHYRRATELLTDNYEPHLYYGEFLCFALRKFRLGEHHLRRALALNLENGVSHYTYGKFLYEQGRHEDAKVQLQLADRLGDGRALSYLESYQ